MKIIFTIILYFINSTVNSQCFDLLSQKLDSAEKLPYSLIDKRVWNVTSGQNFSVKISDVKYKTKLAFLFQIYGVGDTIDVCLKTLNQKILSRKKISNSDCVLRYDPFKKSENYFIVVKIPPKTEKTSGCIGMIIMERVTKKPFTKIQKIEWKLETIK